MKINNKGNITLFGLAMTLGILAYGLGQISNVLNHHRTMKVRSRVYLCMHYLNVNTAKYLKNMEILNTGIKGSTILQILPPTVIVGSNTKKGLQIAQQTYHFSYMKNLVLNSYCPKTASTFYLKNNPYRTSVAGILKRDLTGSAVLRKKKWKNYIWSANKKIILKTVFQFSGSLVMRFKEKLNLEFIN